MAHDAEQWAYHEGWTAYENGRDVNENPHAPGTQAAYDWAHGWDEAMEYTLEEMRRNDTLRNSYRN